VRTSVVITALATAAVAVSRRRRPARPPRALAPVPALPTQVRRLVEDDADLVVADQDARDEHVLAVLDAHLGRAG
jgi:hypothetical protein